MANMKPSADYTGWKTIDLTACNVHALVQPDGSTNIVARWPKTYTKGEPGPYGTVKGETVHFSQYDVTEWHEVVLTTVPAPAS